MSNRQTIFELGSGHYSLYIPAGSAGIDPLIGLAAHFEVRRPPLQRSENKNAF